MKVLFISHEASRTGAPIALLQELRYIKAHYQDIEFELLIMKGGELFSEFEKICKVHRGWYEYSYKYRLLYKLNRERAICPYLFFFKNGAFDCIYANSGASLKVAFALKKQLNIPIIGHIHEAECHMHAFNISIKEMQSIETFITVSELAANNLISNYGIKRNKIVLQYPISAWLERSIKIGNSFNRLPFRDGSFIVGMFNNGGWYKSTELIPIIVKSFFEKYIDTNCKFVVVGNINDETLYKLVYELRKLNVQNKVVFVGKADNPMEYHYNFDVLLLASREESFSLVAQEAAFMGKPIIAFKGATGAAEWIKDDAGILVPYMDFEHLADAIYMLYKDDDLRFSIGEKAQKIINEMYINNSQLSSIISVIRAHC